MPTPRECFLGVVVVLSLACSDTGDPNATPAATPPATQGGAGGSIATGDAGASGEAGAGGEAIEDKAALCTDTFGDAIPKGFSRIDGTVLAVVQPKDKDCPRPNGDHVIVQITTGGAHYRMVVNVLSDREEADPRVGLAVFEHAFVAPAWADGIHKNLDLDYVIQLDAHADAFTPYELAPLSQRIADELTIGAKVSVYATSSGGDSAHKIHRNTQSEDGAIVVDPTGPSPKWLLFRFQNQSF